MDRRRRECFLKPEVPLHKDGVNLLGGLLQGLISPLGDNPKERWTEDAESAFTSLKLPGVESPRRKSTLRWAQRTQSSQTLLQMLRGKCGFFNVA